MKYFISNKEEKHLDFDKLTESEFLELKNAIDEEIFIYPGTFELSESPDVILKKLSLICSKDCKITLCFINLYQLFVNVANHTVDLGIGHLTCKTIKNPFNVKAAIGFVGSSNLQIDSVYLDENCTLIKMECHVK